MDNVNRNSVADTDNPDTGTRTRNPRSSVNQTSAPENPNHGDHDRTLFTDLPLNNDPTSEFIEALGYCGVNGYIPEVNHMIGLCKRARTDYHLLLSVTSTRTRQYRNNGKHRLQYAIMHRLNDREWVRTLLSVSNKEDIVQVRTPYSTWSSQIIRPNLRHPFVGSRETISKKDSVKISPNSKAKRRRKKRILHVR